MRSAVNMQTTDKCSKCHLVFGPKTLRKILVVIVSVFLIGRDGEREDEKGTVIGSLTSAAPRHQDQLDGPSSCLEVIPASFIVGPCCSGLSVHAAAHVTVYTRCSGA